MWIPTIPSLTHRAPFVRRGGRPPLRPRPREGENPDVVGVDRVGRVRARGVAARGPLHARGLLRHPHHAQQHRRGGGGAADEVGRAAAVVDEDGESVAVSRAKGVFASSGSGGEAGGTNAAGSKAGIVAGPR
eukprot:gene10186-biopygen2932